MFEFLLLHLVVLIIFIIYVGPFILVLSSIIFVITRKSIDKFSKILIIIIILLVTFLLFITTIKFIYKPSEYYSKMEQVKNSKSIIGLTKEEVENELGKPGSIKKSENIYLYNAGTLMKEILFLNHDLWVKSHYYALFVYFDENDIVVSTKLKESLEFYVP